MLGRRSLLNRILLGVVTTIVGGRTMAAVGTESPQQRAARALARASWSGARTRRDHCSVIADVQATLADEIANGAAPIGAQRAVDCPLCRQRITVTADASW